MIMKNPKTNYLCGQLGDIAFVVIYAKYKDKWVYCYHKGRHSFEHPGGHVEDGETPVETAKRELFEETGISDCEIIPLWDYEQVWDDGINKNNGRIFAAIVHSLGEIPEDSEMERIELFDSTPENFTYSREEDIRDRETVDRLIEANKGDR